MITQFNYLNFPIKKIILFKFELKLRSTLTVVSTYLQTTSLNFVSVATLQWVSSTSVCQQQCAHCAFVIRFKTHK